MKNYKKYAIFLLIAIIAMMFATGTHEDKVIPLKEDTIYKLPEIAVRVSCYNATISQCDSSPNVTADNSRINKSSYRKWVGCSRDLMYYHLNFGDTFLLYVEGYFKWDTMIVHDLGNTRLKNTIDILCDTADKKMFCKQGLIKKLR